MFHINDRIEISLLDSNEYFTSRIEDITDSYMIIAMPMSRGIPVYLSNNETFLAKCVSQNQMYRFSCILVDKKLQPIPIWKVSLPFNITRIQQREFVRIHVMLSVVVNVIDPELDSPEIIKVYTKDISAGGLQFADREKYQIGQKLQLTIHFPNLDTIEVIGEVVRVDESPDEPNLYFISVRYAELDEVRRCKIIQFVYKKQLESRNRDL